MGSKVPSHPARILTDRRTGAWIGGMKTILITLFVGLLMVGCNGMTGAHKPHAGTEIPQTIDSPYAGWDKILAEAVETLQWRVKEGETLWLCYLPNEKMPYTGWAKEMYDNSQVSSLRQFKEGKGDGLWTSWYSNGQKKVESIYKDGKLVSIMVWKPNGEKCPVRKIDEDGNGVVVNYDEDGREVVRVTYKDGEVVRD